MQTGFDVKITSFKNISRIEGAWTDEDYKALLEMMGLDDGLDDLAGAELAEMCYMSLSDFEPNESARFVLSYLFPDDFTEGKLDQLSHDMPEERLWEEFSDSQYHHKLFNAYGLLRRAFNGTFTEPTGVQFTVAITTSKPENFEVFADAPNAPMVRLLAGAMDERMILNRLYADQISGDQFTEADGILWKLELISITDMESQYAVTSSAFWFSGLEDIDSFEGKTHADAATDEDEE